MNNKIIAFIGASALVGIVAVPVLSATSTAVSATVTPGVISVLMNTTSIGYGTVEIPSVDRVPTDPSADKIIGATNNGGIPEDFFISGADATGASQNWTIVDGAPSGASTYDYNHKFLDCDNDSACTNPATANSMTTTAEALATGVSVNATEYFKLRLSTPTETGGDLSEHSTTVTVLATAS
ncbi:hypothetical protein IH781_00225 [Patescibacteria group bacterium]|nr:hypothetical protein [Patescibacteria group bacterium]